MVTSDDLSPRASTRSNHRRWLLIGAAVLALLGLGGVAALELAGDDEPKQGGGPYIGATPTDQAEQPETTTFQSCGDLADGGAGVYKVRAKAVSCDRARAVAAVVTGPSANCDEDSCQADGFHCMSEQTGYEQGEYVCTENMTDAEIRFVTSA